MNLASYWFYFAAGVVMLASFFMPGGAASSGWTSYRLEPVLRLHARPVQARPQSRRYHGMRVRWATWLEGAVLVAEIMLIAFFSVPVWSSRVDVLPPEHQSTVVRVVAEQFAWNVHYPGADGIFGPTDISLVLPDNSLGLDRTTRPAATTSAFTSAA